MFQDSRQTLKHTLALSLRRLKYGAPRQKVFCIGFQKTGTTSLQYALSKLGYRVAGVFSVDDLNHPEQMYERAISLIPHFDAFADNPWGIYFKEIDREVPGAKFILTSRDSEKWYDSVCKHFGDSQSLRRKWIYGVSSPIGNKSAYVERLISHQEEVRAYFTDRSEDFIEFDVANGDGWEKLCKHLGKPVPKEPFPRLNTADMRK